MNGNIPIRLTESIVTDMVSKYLDIWFLEFSQSLGNLEDATSQPKSVRIPFGVQFKGTHPYTYGPQDLDMSNLQLVNQDLHFSKFVNSNLENSDFSGSDLRFSQFVGCNLKKANFESSDLSWASISDCNLKGAIFDQSDCYDITFVENETENGITGRTYIHQNQHPLRKSLNFFSRTDPGKKTGRKVNPFHLPGDLRPPHTAAFAYHRQLVIEQYNLSDVETW
jgi:hypothetical protein